MELENIKRRERWEQIRWQTFVLLQPHIKARSLKKPEDLILFEWETKTEEIEELIKMGAFDIFPKQLTT